MANEASKTLEAESFKLRSEEEEDEESSEEGEEDEELQLKEMAELIKKYRSTIPDLVKNTFTSLLAAQLPVPPSPELVSMGARDDAESSKEALFAKEHPETAEKLRLLKDKISNNISTMPTMLRRVNDCISLIDKLDTYDTNIHPALKKKKTH